MKHGEYTKTKCLPSFMHNFSRCPSYQALNWIFAGRSTITIENQLHFFQYFDDKIIYMKNFHLGFLKVQS